MTVTRSKYNSGCLFCSTLGDRGVINHHHNRFIPLLALKLKSIPKVTIDDFHPVDILKAARYNKQSSGTKARITEEEWARPELTEWIVLTEFGKRAIVPLLGPDSLKRHKSRVKIPKRWWEDKVAEAVHYVNSGSFDLDSFMADVLEEAYGVWYPGEEYVGFEDMDEPMQYPEMENPNSGGLTFSAPNAPFMGSPKSSAYIASRMAAIVMDPEDDQEIFQKHEEMPLEEKRVKRQSNFSFSQKYEETDSEEKRIKTQTDFDAFLF